MAAAGVGGAAVEPYRRWAVAFVDPQRSMNLGYVARTMANFGLADLVVISGDERKLRSKTAMKYAAHGSRVLENARVLPSIGSLRRERGLLIATTAKVFGASRRVIRRGITPEELVDMAAYREDVAIVLGRDTVGLTNDEIAECDFVMHVPTWTDYPTLNISHALAIMLYAIAKGYHSGYELYHIAHARAEELSAFNALISRTMDALEYGPGRSRKISVLLRRLAQRGDRAEVRSLMGVIRGLLARADGGAEPPGQSPSGSRGARARGTAGNA